MFKTFFILIFFTALLSCNDLPSTPAPEPEPIKKAGVYVGTYKKSSSSIFTNNFNIATNGTIVVNSIIWPCTINVKSRENPVKITNINDGYTIDFIELTAVSTTNTNFIYKLVRYELETLSSLSY